jgi:hypothetical protein
VSRYLRLVRDELNEQNELSTSNSTLSSLNSFSSSGIPKPEDQFIVMAGIRLPKPVGIDCPQHPTYSLVWRDGQHWCRRGRHVVEPPAVLTRVTLEAAD